MLQREKCPTLTGTPFQNEKACRGRRCGRLSEKNRTTAWEEELLSFLQANFGRRRSWPDIETSREEDASFR